MLRGPYGLLTELLFDDLAKGVIELGVGIRVRLMMGRVSLDHEERGGLALTHLPIILNLKLSSTK